MRVEKFAACGGDADIVAGGESAGNAACLMQGAHGIANGRGILGQGISELGGIHTAVGGIQKAQDGKLQIHWIGHPFCGEIRQSYRSGKNFTRVPALCGVRRQR